MWTEPWKDLTPAREAHAPAPAGAPAQTAIDTQKPRVSLSVQARRRDLVIGMWPAAIDRTGLNPPRRRMVRDYARLSPRRPVDRTLVFIVLSTSTETMSGASHSIWYLLSESARLEWHRSLSGPRSLQAAVLAPILHQGEAPRVSRGAVSAA